MKTVLMVAYHYPPEGSSSGVQRTLKFSRYLREFGWRPVVLTASPRAYLVSRDDQLSEIPDDVVVRRAFALDTQRHLSLFGRYFRFMALPDRWVSWWPGAVWSGLHLIRRHRPDVIWSTFPIATAHAVAATLRRISGLPWVADFRDSMTEEAYPRDETKRRVYRKIERRTMLATSRAVFTAPGAATMYRERYPEIPARRLAVLPNGYDEDSFLEAEEDAPSDVGRDDESQIVLLHSGILYPSERDPRCFYDALALLRKDGTIGPRSLRVVLRATGHDEHHRRLIGERGIGDVVSLESRVPYRQALREMLDVDGLLVFQASNCNHQVPAKIYEYLRARRPILALTDPAGDTASALRDAGASSIAPLDDTRAIADQLVHLMKLIERARSEGRAAAASDDVARHSRRARTEHLASMLDEVVAEASS